MGSQSLYRKWRSQTFSDLIGQEAVTRTLLHAVRDSRLAHAYLFCGPRGTGKTSAARLLAKAANCASPVEGEPCNECLSCREITAGHSPDVLEIDAASNTGVDHIRDLRENVNLLGVGGRYKLYIIDEAHMLSTQAFNALLKTLEEPPPHVIFVLATTEVHKIPATVVSRCQQFYFRRFQLHDLQSRLEYVAGQESLELELGAAELLARAAQGGMRDALSLLEQAVAYCGPRIDLVHTRAMLGLADPGMIVALIESVADGDAARGLFLINEMVDSGADLRQLNGQVGEEWRALLLARAGADIAHLLERNSDEIAEIHALAERFTLAELSACARHFARNESPARGLPVPQLALELSFLDCVLLRGERASSTAAQTLPRERAGEAGPTTHSVPSPAASIPWESAEELDLDTAQPLRPPAGSPPATATGPKNEPGAGGAALNSRETLFQAQSQWDLIKQVCKQKSRSVAALLHSARPVQAEPGDVTVLVVEAAYQFHLDKLRQPESRAAVEWALEQVLSQPVHVKLVLRNESDGNGGGPASGGRGGSGGHDTTHTGAVASSKPAAPPAVGGAAPADNITPLRRTLDPPLESSSAGVRSQPPVPSPDDTNAGRERLELEVRADPVVQSLLRVQGMELLELRMLEEDE